MASLRDDVFTVEGVKSLERDGIARQEIKRPHERLDCTLDNGQGRKIPPVVE